jgi:hypothetical protein
MAKNKLSDLNDHLFAQIERLSEEDIDDVEIDRETKRGKAIAALSKEVIGAHRLVLDAATLLSKGNIHSEKIPESFGLKEAKNIEEKSKQKPPTK